MVQVSGIKRKKKVTWYSWIIHKQMAYIINRSVHQCLVHRYNKSEFYYYITCGTRNQIANIHWIIEKARELQKNIYFCFVDYAKAFECVDHNKLCVENSSRDGDTRPPYLPPEKSVCRSRSNS